MEVPKKKAGEESIDVTYTYDINSILEVEVQVNSTKRENAENYEKQGKSYDRRRDRSQNAGAFLSKNSSTEQEENKLLLLQGERLYEWNVLVIQGNRWSMNYSVLKWC